MANLPMPETALKCPRCESTNTKFCYFNNYSLSQPRHFCKTCRRYWTRGGALRSVPVGGGCRRNKRSKGSNSNSNNSSTKSPANSDRQAGSTASSINSISSNNTVSATDHIVGFAPLRFMAPLHHHQHQNQHQVQLNDFATGDLGLIYGPSYSPNYGPIGGELGTVLGNGLEQWRMPMPMSLPQQQQFPFLEGSQAANLYPFETNGSNHNHYEAFTGGYMRPKAISTSGVITQLASVKMEDSNINKELNLSSHFLGISSVNNQASDQQYWTSVGAGVGGSSAAWTDISSFSSSSNTSNHM